MKILRVDDDVHEIISKLAEAEDRKLTPYLNRHFRELGQAGELIPFTGRAGEPTVAKFMPMQPAVFSQSTICKEHGIDKADCKFMKHKRKA